MKHQGGGDEGTDRKGKRIEGEHEGAQTRMDSALQRELRDPFQAVCSIISTPKRENGLLLLKVEKNCSYREFNIFPWEAENRRPLTLEVQEV